jgi:hypothetical protein
MSNIVEGEDFYYNDDGFMVLTSTYHIRRGKCCGRGCLHCPYLYENVETEKRNTLLHERPPVILITTNTK